MTPTILSVGAIQVLTCAPQGKKIRDERDALDLIGEALQHGASAIVIPVERLDEDFFRLRTGISGAMLQKFMTYGRILAIVGDISGHVDASSAFRDFVSESNRGGDIWFVSNIAELEQKLQSQRSSSRNT